MNRTQRVVAIILGVVFALAVVMSILFTPASLMVLAFALWVLFVLGEGDVGNPYKRGRLIYIVDNDKVKSQMMAEANEKAKGGYFGFKLFIALLGALLFAISAVYIVYFLD